LPVFEASLSFNMNDLPGPKSLFFSQWPLNAEIALSFPPFVCAVCPACSRVVFIKFFSSLHYSFKTFVLPGESVWRTLRQSVRELSGSFQHGPSLVFSSNILPLCFVLVLLSHAIFSIYSLVDCCILFSPCLDAPV